MSEENPADQATEELWTYAGRRAVKGKRVYAWRDGTGKGLIYKEIKGSVVGGRHRLKVLRRGDRVNVYGEPVYTGDRTDEKTRREMEALDFVTEATLSAKAMERSDSRKKALDEALAPLIEISAKLHFGHDRDAFVAYVIRRITNPW